MKKKIYVFLEFQDFNEPFVKVFTSLDDALLYKIREERKLKERTESETISVDGKKRKVYDDCHVYDLLNGCRAQLVRYHYNKGREVINIEIREQEIEI